MDGRNKPNKSTISAMKELAKELEGLTKRDDEKLSEYYDVVKHDLDRISDVLLPRVIQFSSDQEIITDLIDFDVSKNELNSKIKYEWGESIPVKYFLVLFVLSSEVVYESICKEWEVRKELADISNGCNIFLRP
ncbi:MAG TPA: hypothetical protein HA349_04290 [Methanotrichaceae archaeon]|nr:hypothetical protein [Methanotrichaceae archaeon]